MNKSFNELLIKISSVKEEELMSKHTTFKVGGKVDYFVMPSSVGEIKDILLLCKNYNVPLFIMGNGSNLLVSDLGFRGVVLSIGNAFNKIQIQDDILTVEAGALLSKISNVALKNSLTGFEFAGGIPGTLGGAVSMNAGAYGSEIKDVLLDVEVIDKDGNLITISNSDLEFGYRTSIITKKDYIVLSARIKLQRGNSDKIKEKMEELLIARKTKQPLEYPSAGSTFKRPEGYFAGKLIQDAGLKGYRVGGAEVSQKHSGFVINIGNATARDIYNLIRYIQKEVYEKFSISLETEVKFVGDFS